MTDIQLHNTKTRRKEALVPIDPQNLRMYVCGPTVYDRAHIGNARPVIVFDTLFRLLRHVYGEDHVTYVRNFTDVDDKINARAAESGRSIRQITDETTQWYLEDMAAVGALEPTHMPRATEYIAQMIAMAEDLIAKGHAYAAEGHVLFAVESYAEYGKLSGRSVDDMIAGARVEVAPYKRNPMDFVIWKPSDAGTPGWDSPWGRGRPGWHIECSAMAYDLLGARFDIHGGGNDLMFPHHENEIAQSRCCGHGFANVWMHNEMLQVEGKKMSKSLGNFFTVRDLLDQGVPGEVIRFVFLSTHYRKPMDWTEKKASEALNWLKNLSTEMTSYQFLLDLPPEEELVSGDIVNALSDDLNTSLALTHLRALVKTISKRDRGSSEEQALHEETMKQVIASAELLLGLDVRGFAKRYLASEEFASKEKRSLLMDAHNAEWPKNTLEAKLDAARTEAMRTKDFSGVDAMKSALLAAGVEVRMSKDGVELVAGPGFDAAKLEGLL